MPKSVVPTIKTVPVKNSSMKIISKGQIKNDTNKNIKSNEKSPRTNRIQNLKKIKKIKKILMKNLLQKNFLQYE